MMLSLSLRESEEEPGMEGDISLDDSFTEVARKVLNTNMNALTETYSLLDEDSFFRPLMPFIRQSAFTFSVWEQAF